MGLHDAPSLGTGTGARRRRWSSCTGHAAPAGGADAADLHDGDTP